MKETRLLLIGSSIISSIAFLGALTLVPGIYDELTSMQEAVQEAVDEFKVGLERKTRVTVIRAGGDGLVVGRADGDSNWRHAAISSRAQSTAVDEVEALRGPARLLPV